MSTLALGATLALTAVHVGTAALAAARYRTEPQAHTGAMRPSITLLRPVCGLDQFDRETLESSFLLTYPDYEIIFCAARADDPACAALREMMARHPGRRARLLVGDERISGNPKLNNMVKGWAAANGSHVAMADSNLLLPPDYLERLLAVWTADCALVTSPAAGTRPQNLWGAVECAFLNGLQARLQLAADSLGAGFAQGKTLFMEKAWLDAQGGLGALSDSLAEDVALTKLVRAQGKRVRLARQAFDQPVGRRDLRAVWGRQLRWSRVRRDGFAGLFILEVLLGVLPPAILLLAGGQAASLFTLLIVWYGTEMLLARAAGWPSGPRDLAAMVLRDLMLPATWAATWARRGFEWRGNAMGLTRDPV